MEKAVLKISMAVLFQLLSALLPLLASGQTPTPTPAPVPAVVPVVIPPVVPTVTPTVTPTPVPLPEPSIVFLDGGTGKAVSPAALEEMDAVIVRVVNARGKNHVWACIGAKRNFLTGLGNAPIFIARQGSYTFIASGVVDADTPEQVLESFAIGPPPPPVPVTPPTPVTPPGPTPGPVVTPLAQSLKVLIVYDAATKSQLPKAQRAILDSPTVADFLDANCSKTGTVADWRMVDQGIVFGADQPIFRDARKLPLTPLPCLIYSNGKDGGIVPLPADEPGLKAVLSPLVGK